MTTQSLLPNDLIDALLSNYKKPEDLIVFHLLFQVAPLSQVDYPSSDTAQGSTYR